MKTTTKREGAPGKPTVHGRKSASFLLTANESARIFAMLATYDTPPTFSKFVKACALLGLAAKETSLPILKSKGRRS